MKLFYTFLLLLLLSGSLYSQEFSWAENYSVSNTNEVASLVVDADANAYLCGVHEADVYLPYNGDVYIIKADTEGNMIWTQYLEGDIILSDMVAMDEGLVIMGQSNGLISYNGDNYGVSNYYMFLIKISELGIVEWFSYDITKYGDHGDLKVDGEKLAVHVRGQGNLGDHIQLFDFDGNLLQERLLSAATNFGDMEFYNDYVYMNGAAFNGEDFIIDDIVIEAPLIENALFTIALDETLTAQWAHVDSAIVNLGGKVLADASGIFVLEDVFVDGFIMHKRLKKLNFDGELQAYVDPPFFTDNVSLSSDFAINDEAMAIFVQNDFNFNSHKVLLYDHELNLLNELIIDGQSDLYSGQLAALEEDFLLAHVQSGDLNFNNEMTLEYSGTGKQAYVAKVSLEDEISGINLISSASVNMFPNPSEGVFYFSGIENADLLLYNLQGQLVKRFYGVGNELIGLENVSPGIYQVHILKDGLFVANEKLIIK